MLNNYIVIVLLCLTLGLAPFFPEPHIWGKLKWVAGGANGMQPMDWFDLAFHAFPFILLVRRLVLDLLVFRAPEESMDGNS